MGTPWWRSYPDLIGDKKMATTEEVKAMNCDYCDNTESITTIIDKTGESPDIHICRDCYATGQAEEV